TGDREQELVELVRPGVEAHLDESDAEPRVAFGDHRGVERLRAGDVAGLRPEPALRDDVLDELVLVEDGCVHSGFFSWNQKNPLGLRVSKYGSSPIGGNFERPLISSGTRPAKRDRSSCTACADPARLCTQRTMSSS